MDTLEQADAAAAEVSKDPRVSLDDIKAAIGAVYYTNAEVVALHSGHVNYNGKERPFPGAMSAYTICLAVMKNGYIIIGTSAPVSPTNFNYELGRDLAYKDVIRQVWPLMGFKLKDDLSKGVDRQG